VDGTKAKIVVPPEMEDEFLEARAVWESEGAKYRIAD
jgi:hypothetical protein